MEIVLASGNSNKKFEIERLLPTHTVLSPEERGIRFEYEETGSTFLENALGKARHLHKLTGDAVIADDSGLCVPALDGEPGVFSARYGSLEAESKLTDADRNAYLLKNMAGVEDRRAFFVCAMVLVLGEYRFYVAQETVNGEITHSPRGNGGFGYDPLFYIPGLGKTAAELSPQEKNRISHRGKAVAALASLMDGIVT